MNDSILDTRTDLLPPAPARPHPIDAALASLGEAAAELIASGRPSRFAELRNLAHVAMSVQRLRPAAGVDDVLLEEDDEDGPFPPIRRRHHVRFNDGADLNAQVLMMAQSFLKEYTEIERAKASAPKSPESRLNAVMEVTSLVELRLRMTKEGEQVPQEVIARIDHLFKRIGEHHESDPVVPAEPVRGHQADDSGRPDGGGVGEPVAERAIGDGGAGEKV